MERQKRVYRVIKSEADRIDLNVTIDTLFFHDELSGDYIPIVEVLEEESAQVLKKIQHSTTSKVSYSIYYQDTFLDIAKNLSGGEIRVLMHLIGGMKYENVVFGVTLRGVAAKIGGGVNTVKDALIGLKNKNLIKETGTRGKKVIHINPSIVWKGNWYKKKYKVDMFMNEDNKDAITESRNDA